MSWVPRFKLYNQSDTVLLYTCPIVQACNYPQTPTETVVHSTIRGKGCIIIDGGDSAWDLYIKGILVADDYEALIVLIDAMESAIPSKTPFILKIDKTPTTTYTYHVTRIEPIQYEDSFRINMQNYQLIFRVNSW
jgi:hypothetical protein